MLIQSLIFLVFSLSLISTYGGGRSFSVVPPRFGEKNLKCIQHNSSRLLLIAFNGAYERKGESQYAEFILRAT